MSHITFDFANQSAGAGFTSSSPNFCIVPLIAADETFAPLPS